MQHEDEMTEEEYRAHMAKERGEDYVHPDDHKPEDLRFRNARLAIFHELDMHQAEVWNSTERSTQDEYAGLILAGIPTGTAAQRFCVNHCR